MVEKYSQNIHLLKETFSFSFSALFFSKSFKEDNQVVFLLGGKKVNFPFSVRVAVVLTLHHTVAMCLGQCGTYKDCVRGKTQCPRKHRERERERERENERMRARHKET